MDTKQSTVRWDAIEPPDAGLIKPMATLSHCSDDEAKELAKKLAVLKLNGGLGTSMGCVGPKSAIEVRSGETFLDLTVKQIQHLNKTTGGDVPLVLMNSFNTHEDTAKLLEKYNLGGVNFLTFNQSKFPRIVKDSLLPFPKSTTGDIEEWYPPGHGDIYHAIYNSGVLDTLIGQGKEFLFVSNVDNLGGTVQFDILKHMKESEAEYIMEVTDKTRADIKGGTLIKYFGQIKLLEVAQVPKQHVPEFQSIKKFKIFNTNNLWINLKAIKRVIEENLLKNIDIIANPKVVRGTSVIQLETAAGAAIEFFRKAHGINVPRNRFLPVKSTSDLFIIQSDLYATQHGSLIMNPNRPFPSVPIVKLGLKFKNVSDYQSRLGGKVNIIELDQLTISGDVTLGRDVVLKGTVIIVANDGCRIDIPNGSVLEDKVVTGNLRVLDH
uniref:UTP--glucose-1-phosphate uridylyltransferase n=1 Tax=Arcella intermedia TaxID=1963864 RepID=A0A6B2L365_9EUKA